MTDLASAIEFTTPNGVVLVAAEERSTCLGCYYHDQAKNAPTCLHQDHDVPFCSIGWRNDRRNIIWVKKDQQ